MRASTRQHEDAANGTAEGPHRSDLVVRHLDRDMPAAQCSTGEQKALLIAVMLANAKAEAERRGAAPATDPEKTERFGAGRVQACTWKQPPDG